MIQEKGLLPDQKDRRDYRSEIVMGAIQLPVEYSLADKIGNIKEQDGSSSCTAQAFSYYAEVLNFIETGQKIQLSARDIYSLIYQPEGGSALRDAALKIVKSGIVLEADAPSYLNGNPPSEPFMRQRNDITQDEIDRGNTYLAKSAVRVPENSIEAVQQAIYQNSGCVIGAQGRNDDWQTAFVKPGGIVWYHAFYACGWKVIGGKTYIQFVNSWGKQWGEGGFGYIGKDYFDAGKVINPWTIADQPNSFWFNLNQRVSILKQLIVLYQAMIQLMKKPI